MPRYSALYVCVGCGKGGDPHWVEVDPSAEGYGYCTLCRVLPELPPKRFEMGLHGAVPAPAGSIDLERML